MKAFSRTIRHLSSLLPPDGHDRSIRYRRLDYVNEAAYSRVWSLRFTRRYCWPYWQCRQWRP